MAKALGNGVPVGACWARAEVAAAFGPGDHGSTFGGQPLALSAVRATLAEDGGKASRATARAETASRSGDLVIGRVVPIPSLHARDPRRISTKQNRI